MANNTFQVRRTSVAGRTPNTTNSGNSQYINAGELGMNMTDQILYSSDGTNLFLIGANVVNQSVTNAVAIGNTTVNTSISVANGIRGGFSVNTYNAGTLSSGTFTPSPINGNYQYLTSNGAFTFATPAYDCAMDVLITNGTGAGTVTFSGYTVGNTGGVLTTTSGNKFIVSLRRINAVATYSIYALQ